MPWDARSRPTLRASSSVSPAINRSTRVRPRGLVSKTSRTFGLSAVPTTARRVMFMISLHCARHTGRERRYRRHLRRMNTIPTTQCTYPGSGIRHPVEDGSGSPRLRIGAKPLPGKRIEILVKTTLTDLRQGVLAQLVSDVELADSCPRPPEQP